jgi:hypothetical protein
MSSDVNERRSTLFLDPVSGRWVETENENSRFKLSSLWRMPKPRGIVENQIYERFDRGGWQEMNPSSESQLSGAEQGYAFQSKPRVGDDGHYFEITSVRYVDQNMKPLLEGIPILDTDLKPLAGGPMMAVNVFCIPGSQMPTFVQRVQERGGVINESQADLHVMYAKLQRLSDIATELESLCTQSRSVIDQVAEGVTTEVPSITERCKRAHSLREEASRINRSILEEGAAVNKHVGQVEAQAQAEAYSEHAARFLEHIEKLHREHTSYEAQAKLRTKQSISQTLPGVDSPASTTRYLLMDVVEFYTELGYDCRLTADGMVLRLGDTIVELADKPSVRSASGETSADQILGRTTAERTQREL